MKRWFYAALATSSPAARFPLTGLGVVAVAILAPRLAQFHRQSHPVFMTHLGEHRSITLAGATLLDINTNSKLKVRFAPNTREIQLVYGEILATVSHIDPRPFKVVAGNFTISDAGTQFDVRLADEDKLIVPVAQGTVTLRHKGADATDPYPVILRAGDLAQPVDSEIAVQRLGVKEIERSTLWTVGTLSFDYTIAEAGAESNRYYKTKLVVDNQALGETLIHGEFRTTDINAFVEALQNRVPDLVVLRTDDEIHLGTRPEHVP